MFADEPEDLGAMQHGQLSIQSYHSLSVHSCGHPMPPACCNIRPETAAAEITAHAALCSLRRGGKATPCRPHLSHSNHHANTLQRTTRHHCYRTHRHPHASNQTQSQLSTHNTRDGLANTAQRTAAQRILARFELVSHMRVFCRACVQSSRVTRHSGGGVDLDSDSKWDVDSPRSLRGRGQKDDYKQQAALHRSSREKVQQELQAAKGKINKAERIVAEEPEQEPIDDDASEGDEEETGEDLGSQLHDVTAALRSRASQAKSAVRQKAAQLKQKGASVARDAQDAAAKLQAPKSLRDGVESAKRTIRRKKADLEGTQDEEGEEDEAEDDEEGAAPSDWQSSLYAKGTSLMHSATDAAASLRSRIAEAAPGLQSKASSVLRSARKQLDSIDFADGEQQAEEDEEDEGQDRSEGEEGEEGEESLVSRLRSRAPSTDAVASQAKTALGRGKEALGRGKEMLDATLRSEPLKQAKQKGQQLVDQARSTGEKIVNKARTTVAEFDWDQPKTQAQSTLRDAKSKTTQGVRSLRQKGEELIDGARRSLNRDDEDESEGDEEQEDDEGSSTLDRSKASLRRFGDAVSSQATQLKGRARDALDEAEEDLGMKSPSSPMLQSSTSDAAFNRAAARGLNKFDRVVAKDGNMKLPLAVIGTIFLLWLGASVYNLVNPVEPEPVVPANVFEQARMAAHDLKVTGLGHLHNLESRTHDLVDKITGRPKQLTWSEKTWNWLTTPFARVHTDHLDAAHARDAIRNARSELEDRGYELKNTLEGKADWAQDKIDRARHYAEHKIIPTARDGLHHAAETARINAADLEYKRAHLGDYMHTAKESAQNLKNMAQHKGEDLNLLPKQSLSARVWAWATGADTETYPQKAQRYVNEAADKVQSGLEFARDAMPHERTLGERIRAHLPGHKLTPAEEVEAYLSKIQRNIPNLDPSGTARDYYNRALAAGYELRDDAYAKVQELTKPSLMDRLKAWIPGAHHASLADRIQRNVPNLDVSGTAQEYYERARAAGYELKDGVYEKVHDAVSPSLGDRIRSMMPGGHDPMLEKVMRNVPDLDPRGTAQDYYARAKAAGYELKDGMYQRVHDLTHPTLMDRLREWLPHAHHASLADRIERNIPNLDPRGTAQEYYERARAAGYDLKDGVYTRMHDLTHQSLGDRIKAHLPSMHQRTIPNLDIRGTAQEYADRAREAGYELRNGAYQLMDRAQNQHPMHTTTNLDPAADIRLRGHGPNLHMHDAVPLRDIQADMAHAQPAPDPLAHHESVLEKMKHAVEDGVNSIKSHLPGRAAPVQPVVVETPRSTLGAHAEALKDDIRARVAGAESTVRTGLNDAEARLRAGVDHAKAEVRADLHHARKGAEYVGHRVIHNAEAAGHRVEEKYHDVKDKVEYRLP